MKPERKQSEKVEKLQDSSLVMESVDIIFGRGHDDIKVSNAADKKYVWLTLLWV